MLDAAEVLFEEHGFQKTTMEMIATWAGFGVATLYKYFGSKEGIIRELFVPDLRRLFDLGETIIQDPPEDPADAVVALIRCYTMLRNNWRDRRLLRMLSVPAMLDEHGVLANIVDWTDAKAIEQIRDLVRALQLRGRMPRGVDAADMATVVFAVFNHEYFLYVMHENVQAVRAFEDIERLVRTLFEPWRIEYAAARTPVRASGKSAGKPA